MKIKMKRNLMIFGFVVLFLFMIYNYYDTKVTEVYLTGKVIGFNTEDVINETYTKSTKSVNASYKAIGTMTFIKATGEYVALGHSTSGDNNGECYEINYACIQKSKEGNVGKIIADLDEDSKIGDISKNSMYGVFGTVDRIGAHKSKKIKTASRYEIEKGTAYILIDFDGTGIKEYEIEIEGINHLSFTKNINISVKSEELIEKCGGIVQGMSGTPIVQNGKLIGAVNCVDTDNPLQAHGIFVDKLI